MNNKIPIATSSCLLGNNVRFNGANCHKKLITEQLGEVFEMIPICPELSAGLGVPRKPIRLVTHEDQVAAISEDQQKGNVTEAIGQAIDAIIDHLPPIHGFILKKSSPSCGFDSVKLYNENNGIVSHKSDGLLIKKLRQRMPLMPVEDEGRLNDTYLKEHFIKRVFLTYEANQYIESATSISELMAFHTRHKILLRLHHPDNQKKLGRLLAQHDRRALSSIKNEYYTLFLQSFTKVAKAGQHIGILQRLLREINKNISKAERADFQKKITLFQEQKLPLAVPVEMIKHYLVRYDIAYLKQQSYLNLYPEHLALMSAM